jgi:hypothetical protein
MRMTGHFNAKTYLKYNQTLEAQSRAAQRCVAKNIRYPRALELETQELSKVMIEGLRGRSATVRCLVP